MTLKQKLITFVAMIIGLAIMSFTPQPTFAATCGGVTTSIISCPATKTSNGSADVTQNAIWQILLLILKIMAAGVGIVAVGGIVYAAILYASADDRPDQTKKAKEIIYNVCYGIAAFVMMYAVLNFLIPGGVFK